VSGKFSDRRHASAATLHLYNDTGDVVDMQYGAYIGQEFVQGRHLNGKGDSNGGTVDSFDTLM
jgi:hypothetical protein